MMQNKKLVFGFFLAVLILGIIFYFMYPTPQTYDGADEPGGVACTMEAKQCPDGSYVGRQGPKCEFAPCPIPAGATMEDGTIIDSSTTIELE